MNNLTTPSKLYLASSNSGKLREFQEAAEAAGITVEPVPRIEALPPCFEDGHTFEENARKKVAHYAAFISGPIFADDSGLAVDALGGAPGVYSARFSGPNAADEANNEKLIEELHRISASSREPASSVRPDNSQNDTFPLGGLPAHYVCVIALALGNYIITFEGRVDGLVITTPRGNGGFGYDPYFFYPPFGKTFAEITSQEKFAVSHRGIAFRKLLAYMQTDRLPQSFP